MIRSHAKRIVVRVRKSRIALAPPPSETEEYYAVESSDWLDEIEFGASTVVYGYQPENESVL